jgi:isoleucyl-tRNA synthetase
MDYFQVQDSLIDQELEQGMSRARAIVRLALQIRAKMGCKVRQPLAELRVKGQALSDPLVELIAEEINVKKIDFIETLPESENWVSSEENDLSISLNSELTPELRQEGWIREIIRSIQTMRKKSELTPQDQIIIYYRATDEIAALIEKNLSSFHQENRAKEIKRLIDDSLIELEKINLGDQEVWLAIKD